MGLANARFGDGGPLIPDPAPVVLVGGATPYVIDGVSPQRDAQPYPTVPRMSFATPARVARRDQTYFVRPMLWRAAWFNGAHGVIRRLRPSSWSAQQNPLNRPNRTLRSAPAAPWDVGTAMGPTGAMAGGES